MSGSFYLSSVHFSFFIFIRNSFFFLTWIFSSFSVLSVFIVLARQIFNSFIDFQNVILLYLFFFLFSLFFFSIFILFRINSFSFFIRMSFLFVYRLPFIYFYWFHCLPFLSPWYFGACLSRSSSTSRSASLFWKFYFHMFSIFRHFIVAPIFQPFLFIVLLTNHHLVPYTY